MKRKYIFLVLLIDFVVPQKSIKDSNAILNAFQDCSVRLNLDVSKVRLEAPAFPLAIFNIKSSRNAIENFVPLKVPLTATEARYTVEKRQRLCSTLFFLTYELPIKYYWCLDLKIQIDVKN